MSRYFSQLPEEIILEICKNLSSSSLAAFVKASSRTYRIGQPVLYSPQPDSRELLYVIKWSAKRNQERSKQYALPRILRSNEETRFRGLIHASKAGFTDIVRTLLDSGVCPDPPITGMQSSENPLEFEEISPLLAALRGGHYEIAEMLLASGDKRTGQILIDQGLEFHHVDPSDHSTMLHKLCNIEHAPLASIELLLDNGLDINQTNANRESPLDWAIRFGKPRSTQQDIVRLLLARGAQINEPCNVNGDHPIHVALDYAPMVQLLIQMGSSVNVVNNRDMTPLGVLGFRDFTIYCNDQEYEVAKALLEAGALLSVNVPWAARLIKRAAISGHVDYVRLLLDTWERQLSHRQPLPLTARFLAAAALGDIQTMDDVLNIKPEFLDTLPADYPSALEIAAKGRNQEAIRFIVSKMHYYAGNHGLALCHVLAHGSEETICLLLSRISFVQKKDLISAVTKYSSVPLALLLGRLAELISERDKLSPENALEFDDDEEITHNISRALKVAAATGKTEAVCLLLQFMARHNLDCSHLPLVSAAKHGHDEIALIIIRQGHALNTPDEHGNTPLMIASSLGRVTIMKALIEAGVDPTETNTRGRSPILMAAAGEHHDAVRYLMDTIPLTRLLPPGNPKTDIERMNLLAYAARYNVADLGDYLMTHPDIYGNLVELFFWAAYHGKVHLVQVLFSHAPFRLLQHESKLRIQERLNQTALIYGTSAPEERPRVVKALLHHGADVDQDDLQGRTTLSYAAENDYVDTARLLVAAGADTFKANKKGKTPLHYASSDEMVRILYSGR